MQTQARTLAAGLVLALWCIPAHAQQPVGALFFAHPGDGGMAFGCINRLGGYEQTYYIPGHPTSEVLGATHVVNTANGFLVYNMNTGKAVVLRLTNAGYPALGGYYWFSRYWLYIVNLGDFLFFYNWNGSAAIGHLTPGGAFVQTQGGGPGWFGQWTHVTATDNHLFFYNENSGWAAVGYIHPDGFFVLTQVIPPGMLELGISYMVKNGSYLLLYNQQTGSTTVGYINRDGQFTITDTLVLPTGYHMLVQHAGHLLLQWTNNDSATIGHIDHDGHFIVTQTPVIGSGVTRIVSTGEHLLFYIPNSGSGRVGYIDRDGQFQETANNVGLLTSLDHVAATAR